MKYLLIKLTDPDIRIKKLRYPDPDPALTDSTFYYQDPDSIPPDIRIFGSDPDRISDRIRISDKSSRPTLNPLWIYHRKVQFVLKLLTDYFSIFGNSSLTFPHFSWILYSNLYYNRSVFAHSLARHIIVLWAPFLKSVKKCQAHGSNPGY